RHSSAPDAPRVVQGRRPRLTTGIVRQRKRRPHSNGWISSLLLIAQATSKPFGGPEFAKGARAEAILQIPDVVNELQYGSESSERRIYHGCRDQRASS